MHIGMDTTTDDSTVGMDGVRSTTHGIILHGMVLAIGMTHGMTHGTPHGCTLRGMTHTSRHGTTHSTTGHSPAGTTEDGGDMVDGGVATSQS